MIKKYKAQNKDAGLVVLWIKLRRAGYTKEHNKFISSNAKIKII